MQVRIFFDPDARVLGVALVLTFDAPYWDAYVFPDDNEMVIDTNASCKKMISYVQVITGYFECGSGLAW